MTTAGATRRGRRERERALHRQEILAAAERVFARSGYGAATMAGIAGEAEFAVGTLYRFFASKEELFEQLLLEQVRALDAEIAEAIAASPDVRTALENVALADVRSKSRRRFFLAQFVAPSAGAFRMVGPDLPRVQVLVKRREARFLALVRRGVAAGELSAALPPELIALALQSMIRAYSIERGVREGREPDEQEVRAFVRAQLDGLGGTRRRRPPPAGKRPRRT